MKKFLAALLSFVLVMSASITVFGATTTDVDKTLETAIEFAFGGKDSFDVSESRDYYLYLSAAEYNEKAEESYFNSLKKALDSGEKFDIGTLGLIISNLILSLEDPTDFEGYDLVEMFEKTELGEYDNMYTYMYAADIAFLFDFEDLGKQLCDKIISKYTLGEGTDFWGGWGTSADDLSVFIITLSVFADDYMEYIDDAIALLKEYNTEAGYDNYGANADSTALALAAYVSVFEEDAAHDAYDKLMLFYNEETGGFNSNYDDVLATKDAIFGLTYYWILADFDYDFDFDFDFDDEDLMDNDEETPKSPIVNTADNSKTEEVSTVEAEKETQASAKSPATGATVGVALFALLASGGLMAVTKKKDN